MCIDSDLFGDVIVTFSDIRLFILNNPRFAGGRSKSALNLYIKQYDVVNKIKRLKQSGEFYNYVFNDPAPFTLDIEQPKYKEIWKRQPCPDHFHVCAWMDCPVFLKYRKQLERQNRYARQKELKKLREAGKIPPAKKRRASKIY